MADAGTRFAQPVRHLRLHLRCALSGARPVWRSQLSVGDDRHRGAAGAAGRRQHHFQPRRPPPAERHSPDVGFDAFAPPAVPGGGAADADMELFQPAASRSTDDAVAAYQRLFLDSGRVQNLLRCPPAVETQYADQQPGAAVVDRTAAGAGERRAAAGVVRGTLHPQQRRTLSGAPLAISWGSCGLAAGYAAPGRALWPLFTESGPAVGHLQSGDSDLYPHRSNHAGQSGRRAGGGAGSAPRPPSVRGGFLCRWR
ncbi:Uncharacterised protein [Serratia marcescens]|uniref:Uncharacterized protein n=1 Tax=Serratia marcescens TaxID=615 RepID=A0A379Z9V3_SERMA|nr:Uncharacterised protein [Serratia marcescens]